jgi:hypothetical protein
MDLISASEPPRRDRTFVLVSLGSVGQKKPMPATPLRQGRLLRAAAALMGARQRRMNWHGQGWNSGQHAHAGACLDQVGLAQIKASVGGIALR